MNDEFQLKGEFYLPSNKDSKVFGTLNYSESQGTYLDLFGSFNNSEDEEEIIWGELENGKIVTLYNSFIVHKKYGSTDLDKYYCNFIFLYVFFNSKKDIQFNKVSVCYSHLDEWLNIRAFKIEPIPKVKYGYRIEYILPSTIEYQVGKLNIAFSFSANGPSRNFVQKEAKISQTAYVVFKTGKKRQFDKISDDINHFSNFLSLATQRPIYYKELIGYLNIGKKNNLQKCKILLKKTSRKEEKQILPPNMLLPYKRIEDRFQSFISNWYRNKKKLETTLIPHMSVYRDITLYESDKFLNLTRALEAFHRDFIHKNSINKTRYIESIRSLSYSYNWLLKIKSIPAFSTKMLKYRNDLTHSNPLQTELMKKYLSLFNISEKLKIINTCLIFHEMGISRKELKNLLEDTGLYVHLKHNLK
ncbi:hypothetical protein FHG64_02785 [Antarcticibacterium flavum]|uniref:Uncharacterized protein n=1 Tax=Antarcticibacterium flavum TaxID=2058175 RepID=A0A5B7WZB0_9FLAO|nr:MULTISPECIES: HEPN domain-containing protein [Antarcticibacterium]MCM4161695.1 hypothetical protein [Antarcticibacterium sp. W02-3]QCY68400.1 hypothetical protein FHG64_02785 [Antarcticibacterium flavum]